MTSLVLLAVAIISTIGWYFALKQWQAALARERLLVETVYKMLIHRSESILRHLDDEPRPETRH